MLFCLIRKANTSGDRCSSSLLAFISSPICSTAYLELLRERNGMTLTMARETKKQNEEKTSLCLKGKMRMFENIIGKGQIIETCNMLLVLVNLY